MAEVINPIIAIGGTTALETPLEPQTLVDWYITPGAALCCHVAAAGSRILGFQALSRHAELPPGWGDIGTFTRRHEGLHGIGRALFAVTRPWARDHGVLAINAAIRADNAGGLAYYRGLGFQLYAQAAAVPLADGTPVDRLYHRLTP